MNRRIRHRGSHQGIMASGDRGVEMKIRSVLIGAVLAIASQSGMTQTMSYGPLYANGVNAQGLPIFMLRCRRGRCVGLHGKDMGTAQHVARFMPAVPAAMIRRYHYRCWILCRDPEGKIVGKPSPDYRNVYQKPGAA